MPRASPGTSQGMVPGDWRGGLSLIRKNPLGLGRGSVSSKPDFAPPRSLLGPLPPELPDLDPARLARVFSLLHQTIPGHVPLGIAVLACFSLSWEAQGEDGQQLRRKEWEKIRTFSYWSPIRDQTQSQAPPADVRAKPDVGLRTVSPGLHLSHREEKHGAWADGVLVRSRGSHLA